MNPYKSALITGASSGLGRALAEALAAPGMTLHLGGRDAARLEQVATACRARGATCLPRVIEVTDAGAMDDWITGAGRLDLVIANAGISGGTGIGGGESATQVRAIFATNLDGALNTMLPALAHLARQSPDPRGHRGTIAAIASIAALVPTPGAPSYGASKAALDAWTRASAPAAATHGIQLTSVCPGFIRTPLTQANPYRMPGLMDADAAAALILRRLPAGARRIAFPWWMAALARTIDLLAPALLTRAAAKPALPDRP